jgi:hypothetical protein
MQQLQEPLERRGRRRDGIRIVLVDPGLDRLQIPVAEIVEGDVVELLDEVREIERIEVRLDRALNL